MVAGPGQHRIPAQPLQPHPALPARWGSGGAGVLSPGVVDRPGAHRRAPAHRSLSSAGAHRAAGTDAGLPQAGGAARSRRGQRDARRPAVDGAALLRSLRRAGSRVLVLDHAPPPLSGSSIVRHAGGGSLGAGCAAFFPNSLFKRASNPATATKISFFPAMRRASSLVPNLARRPTFTSFNAAAPAPPATSAASPYSATRSLPSWKSSEPA